MTLQREGAYGDHCIYRQSDGRIVMNFIDGIVQYTILCFHFNEIHTNEGMEWYCIIEQL